MYGSEVILLCGKDRAHGSIQYKTILSRN